MKNILIYITILSTALFLTNCGGHNHDAHNHEHAHEAHEHNHDAHNHEHAHEAHGHNHDAHNHEHSAESSEPLMFTAYGDSLEIFAEIGKLTNLAPESAEVQAMVKKLQDFITENYYCQHKNALKRYIKQLLCIFIKDFFIFVIT